MNDNVSIETIASPEFINLYPLDVSPLMSSCKIKVLYIGENRNGSFISKDVAINMAKTLRGCPIVGYYRKDEDDFGDHGNVITIENGEVHFSSKTIPYGFVSPVADIWFQKFTDTDALGNSVEREYLVTEGFLWTGQYEEAKKAVEGKGQSMELDRETIDGSWATNDKTGMEFFIINDATFTKLCILGDDIEPCFEGASVEGIPAEFAKEQEFAFTLRRMMKELNNTLYSKGGLSMSEDFIAVNAENEVVEKDAVLKVNTLEDLEDQVVEVEAVLKTDEPLNEDVQEVPENEETVDVVDNEESENSAGEEELLQAEDENTIEAVTVPDGDGTVVIDNDFTVSSDVMSELEELRAYKLAHEDELKELEELRAYKLARENEEKDEVIAKYHMLSDEDKASVVEHKEEYTLQQVEEKLALIYVNKNVDFSTVDGQPEKVEEEVEPIVTFSLDDSNSFIADDGDELHNALRDFVI